MRVMTEAYLREVNHRADGQFQKAFDKDSKNGIEEKLFFQFRNYLLQASCF